MRKLFFLMLICFSTSFAFAQNSQKALSVRELGEEFLKRKSKVAGDEFSFKMFDSLESNSAEAREFCFRVTTHIAKNADGILAEAIGYYWLDYLTMYPNDFFKNYSLLNGEEKQLWHEYLTWVIMIKADFDKTEAIARGKRELFKIRKSCESCETEDLKLFDDFTIMVLKTIDKNIQESN
ncbi:MAG TPA: hypothetical protein VEC36_02485 [Patescibacteria group bacterium]|nr:hypothetical protein [Patescibacteria group bacterium]